MTEERWWIELDLCTEKSPLRLALCASHLPRFAGEDTIAPSQPWHSNAAQCHFILPCEAGEVPEGRRGRRHILGSDGGIAVLNPPYAYCVGPFDNVAFVLDFHGVA